MEDFLQQQELFDKYLQNELTESEILDFDQRLKDDSTFSVEFNLYKDIVVGIKAAGEDKLRAMLKETDSRILSSPVQKPFYKNYYLLAATIAVILIGLSVVFMMKMQKQLPSDKVVKTHDNDTQTVVSDDSLKIIKNQEEIARTDVNPEIEKSDQRENNLLAQNIYNEYYETHPNKLIALSRGAIPTDSLQKAMYYYNNRQFDESAKLLQGLLKNDIKNPDLLFYLAMANLELGEFRDSEMFLQLLTNLHSTSYVYETEWYLALNYLINHHPEKAKALFEKISGSKSPYSEKATAILKEIKNKVQK